MHSSPQLVSAAVLSILFIVGGVSCKSPRRTEPIIGNLNYAESGILAQGRKAFDKHCHSCHPDGDGGLGPSLNDKPFPGTLIAFQVRRGLGVMPRFNSDRLSEEHLEAIVAYLKDLRNRRAKEP